MFFEKVRACVTIGVPYSLKCEGAHVLCCFAGLPFTLLFPLHSCVLTLFVRPYVTLLQTRERDLEDEFTRYGRLSDVFIPTDRHRGGSRGFGFVTFEDKRDAEDAVKDMDG